MAGADNLLKAENLTSEELRERAKKGGIASGKARRKRKALTATINELFSMPLKDGDLDNIEQVQSLAAVKGQNITVQEAIVITQIQKALKGNQSAARLLFDMMGEQLGGDTANTESHNALIEAIRMRNNED